MPANVIDRLVIQLGLDGTDLKKNLIVVNQDMRSFTTNIHNAGSKLAETGKKGADAFAAFRREALGVFALFTGGRGLESFIKSTTDAGVQVGNLSRQLGILPQKLTQLHLMMRAISGNEGAVDSFLSNIQRMSATPEGMRNLQAIGSQLGVQFTDGKGHVRADIIDQLHNSRLFQGMGRNVQDTYVSLAGGNSDITNLATDQDYDRHAKEFSGLGPTRQQIREAQELKESLIALEGQTNQILWKVYGDYEPFIKGILDWLTKLEKEYPEEVAKGLEAVAAGITILGTALTGGTVLRLLRLVGLGGTVAEGVAVAGATAIGVAVAKNDAGQTHDINTGYGQMAGLYTALTGGDKNMPQPKNDNENARRFDRALAAQGIGIFQRMALNARAWFESSFNPSAVGDKGRAYGILQWHPDRQANFKRVIGHDIHGSTIEEQARFVAWELHHSEKRAGDRLARARTAAEAGTIVSRDYIRPQRVDYEAQRTARLAEHFNQMLAVRDAGRPASAHTTVQVGDINVHTSAKNGHEIAHDIHMAFQQELRRNLPLSTPGGLR